MQVIFRTDASAGIGGGHVMRCLALAATLRARGASITFACASILPGLEQQLRRAGHGLIRLSEAHVLPPDLGPWPGEAQIADADAFRKRASPGATDWIIVDHYGLSAVWEERAREGGKTQLAVIDDLAARSHACDLLVDQTLGRSHRDYAQLVPEQCPVLAGAGYALLRSEFRACRAGSLVRRRAGGPVQRLLVSLGTTDVGGITIQVVRALLERGVDCKLDVVIGSNGASLPALAALARLEPRLALYVDTADMAQLASAADLAVGAAGTSSWERCCLGLPAVALILADNQRLVARALGEADAAAVADDPADAARRVVALMADEHQRWRMSAAAAAITDGEGAERVADALTGGAQPGRRQVALRSALETDAQDIWLWRNDPVTRAMSKTSAPIAWPEHLDWYRRTLASQDCETLIAEQDGEAVGIVRADRVAGDETWEVSLNIRPSARGGGTGFAVLEAGWTELARRHSRARLVAQISLSNPASRRIFERVGFWCFEKVGETGFDRYVRSSERTGAGETE